MRVIVICISITSNKVSDKRNNVIFVHKSGCTLILSLISRKKNLIMWRQGSCENIFYLLYMHVNNSVQGRRLYRCNYNYNDLMKMVHFDNEQKHSV